MLHLLFSTVQLPPIAEMRAHAATVNTPQSWAKGLVRTDPQTTVRSRNQAARIPLIKCSHTKHII